MPRPYHKSRKNKATINEALDIVAQELRDSQSYLRNPNLKRAGVPIQFTPELLAEYQKCAADPVYFAKTYMKIVNVDNGLVPFKMYDFQERLIDTYKNERFVIVKTGRQVGKSITTIAWLLHSVLFNSEFSVALLANKFDTAQELLGRFKLAYENLPKWLQQGIIKWSERSIKLENRSTIKASATTAASVRGGTYNLIFLDEYAHIEPKQQLKFFTSTYPVISSGKTTQVIIVSTPNGFGDDFHKKWTESMEGENNYARFEVHWSNVPGRDEAWKLETIRNTSEFQFQQEFEAEFLGSSTTLISGHKLGLLTFDKPIKIDGNFRIFQNPVPGKIYACCVDTSRGLGLDYSALVVIDASDIPYRVVATYQANDISPLLYPMVIHNIARMYNNAHTLLEINDVGSQVADILHHELEYDNIIKITVKGRSGQIISAGHAKKIQFGIKQSEVTKRIGCANLKTIIEQDKLFIADENIRKELYTFISEKNTYKAKEGSHDDLVMCLVLFGWLVAQRYFKDTVQNDVRTVLQKDQMDIMEEDLCDLFVNDGRNDTNFFDDLLDEPDLVWGDNWVSADFDYLYQS